MQIYIDSKYLGRAMRHGRISAAISKRDAAYVFGLTTREYTKIEHGHKLVSPNMLERVMALGFTQLRTRRLTGASELKTLKPNKDDCAIFVSHRDTE